MLNKIFTYWENRPGMQTPEYIRICLESIKNSCDEFHLITPENIYGFIGENDLHPNFKLLTSAAHRADCIRAAVIKKHGGWWVDADTKFIRPIGLIGNFIDNQKDFCFFQWSDGRVLNGYFYAKAQTELMHKWLASINKKLANLDQVQWTSFGEQILTPLVKWHFVDACQCLDREIFLPVNIDRTPFIFAESIDFTTFIKHNTVAFGLNHSWFTNYFPNVITGTIDEFRKSPSLIGQILMRNYELSSFQYLLQIILEKYSYGSVSVGDIDVISKFFAGLDYIVEIGTNQGTTERLLSYICKSVVTVDVFEDLDKIGSAEWKAFYEKAFKNNPHSYIEVSNYLADRSNVKVVKSESSEYLSTCKYETIDGLLIDGDHSREGVKSDFINGINAVKIGGIILFHDVNDVHKEVQDFYFEELCKCDRIEEIHYIPTTFYTSIKIFRRIR